MKIAHKLSLTFSSMSLIVALVSGCGTHLIPSSSSTSDTQEGTTTSQSKQIKIGFINWDEDVATTYLWKQLLEKKGYDVQLNTLSLGPMFVGLSEDSVDVFFDSWLPQQTTYIKKFGDSLTTLGTWYEGRTTEGFVVPQYMKNVNSIADLDKVSAQLGGNIVGIDPGAVEMTLAGKAVTAYGLNLQLIQSSDPAMLSALKAAYGAHKDVAVVLWSPHWAFAKYKLKYLSDPKDIFGQGGYIQTEANKNWAASNPTVAKYFKNFKLTPEQLGTLENDMNAASSKEAGVKKWIAANQTLVDSWLKN